MPEHFTHKHIHSAVWLIIILLAVIIIAAFLIVKLTNNAPLVPEIPTTPVTPGDNGYPGQAGQTVSNVTSGIAAQPSIQAGKVLLESAGSVQAGSEVRLGVKLDTESHNINVAKVALKYDPALLKYESFDKTDSVLTLQFREDAADGQIVLSRGVPGDGDATDSDDGYTGSGGIFGYFLFTALAPGQAAISLDAARSAFYLDDGAGSQLKPSANNLTININ